jgi:outer membrane protein assembly factor BamB
MSLLLCCGIGALVVNDGIAEPWNQFRGPNGSGVAAEARPPIEINPANPQWTISLSPGHSSPVLSSRHVVVTAMDDGRLVTLAIDKASGEIAWRRACPEVELEPVHETSSAAASTPFVDGEHLYVYFGSYGLICYDLQGQMVWQQPIPTPKSQYGMSTSPIVHNDFVILVLDDDANLPDSRLSRSRVVAWNKRTGEVAWETPRPFHRSGWSTPTVWQHDGTTELVILGSGRLTGYDLTTGVEKWFVNGFSRETIGRPIVDDGRIFASASMLGGVADEQPDPEPFWTAVLHFDSNQDQRLERAEMTGPFTLPFRPELPVDHPGFGLPMPSDPEQRAQRLDGMFARIDKDEDGYWTKEEFLRSISFDRGKPMLTSVRPGGSGDITESHVVWALHRGIPEIPSPVLYEGRIYMVSDGGVVTTVAAETGEVIYRKRLAAAGHYRASPVIAAGHLYVISDDGILSVIETGDNFSVRHQADFGEPIAATPAVGDSTIYIRTKSRMLAFVHPQ